VVGMRCWVLGMGFRYGFRYGFSVGRRYGFSVWDLGMGSQRTSRTQTLVSAED